MERVDRRTVLLAKVVTFIGQRKTEDMPGGQEEDKAGVAEEPNRNNNPKGIEENIKFERRNS